MKKYTVRQTYTKTDVWFDVKAKNEDEAIKKFTHQVYLVMMKNLVGIHLQKQKKTRNR